MPRYFFHTEGKSIRTDGEGIDLPGVNAARAEAIRTTGEMLCEAGLRAASQEFCSDKPWRLWVTDGPGGSGTTCLSIHVLVQDGPQPEDLAVWIRRHQTSASDRATATSVP